MSAIYQVLNPIISTILRYPLHRILSNNIMLITMKGRKSGKIITTPVRYVRKGESILCFTANNIVWWRNLLGGAEVTLLIQGKSNKYIATAIENDPILIKSHLQHYFKLFPKDTMYYGIRRNKDRSLNVSDLENAINHVIVIESNKIKGSHAKST